VITCSEPMREEVTRLFALPDDQVRVVPNGVDAPRWTPTARAVAAARAELGEVNAARELGLAACRRAIRAAGSTIRAAHQGRTADVVGLLGECEAAVREAQAALAPHPALAGAGFLHDAEKELAEAVLTAAVLAGDPLPGPAAVGVGVPAWLNGLAEAASELRRAILDRLRRGDAPAAERLFVAMEDAHELLAGVDLPDAVTGGLRRTNDALRAVLERTRSDLTTTTLQRRLQAALEAAAARTAEGGPPLR
ncbi:MAG TPA: hypothetical protein VFP61_16350, partial [Acidimicrobiales bacterium]|nr:hypothetical protein [Acidimicrobiales bacterium]